MCNFSLVVPLYNSQQHLINFIAVLATFIENKQIDAEQIELILIADGGNIDYLEVIAKLKRIGANIQFYVSKDNFGQLNAVAFGLLQARGDRVITMDVDFYNIDDIFVKVLQQNGSELALFELVEENKPLMRRIGAQLNNMIYAIFHDLEGLRGSSLRSMKKTLIDRNEQALRENYKLLDQIFVASAKEIQSHHLAIKYTKSSYSPVQLIKLFFSNFFTRLFKVRSELANYKKVEI